jgi:putative polyhydroxyalkanoate system protein
MAAILIRRSHQLGHDEARGLLTGLAESLERDLDAKWQWEGDELRFERSGAAGRVQLTDDEVSVEVTLGLLLRPLRGTIIAQINERLDEVLGPLA